jgi:hypothetical protein
LLFVLFIVYVVFSLLLLSPQIWRRNETSEADHKGFWYSLKLFCTLSNSSFLEVKSPKLQKNNSSRPCLVRKPGEWGMAMTYCALKIVKITKSMQGYDILLPSPVPNL